MSATFTTVPASYLRYATRTLPSYFNRTRSIVAVEMPLRQPRAYSSAAKGTFTYRLAAAASGKRTPSRAPKPGQDYWLYTSTQANATPPYLRSTKPNSGEDAFFAATVGGSPHDVAFGLADGVGGWQDQGIDPSEFSHGLCGLMAGTAYIHEGLEEGQGSVRPQQLMQTAYEAVIANPRIVAGGCTASLAVVDGKGSMETANLGDSGFVILSPGKISYRSEPQTHAFNTPYQLSKVPPKMQQQNAIFGGSAHFSETPKQADIARHQLRHGDIVLFATDGVWDNLSAQDTLAIVTKVMEEHGYWFKSHNFAGAETMLNETLVRSLPKRVDGKEWLKEANAYLPGLLATAVMREAKVAGLDTKRNGPFAKEVNLHYPQEGWRGGKPDDIAVVVCVAVEDAGQSKEEVKPIKAKL
ncbi:Protein phosphatase 2C 7 [Elasticomyces elasticus]|uniref:Protein phosphatase n=1 Tax=Elasticomyces elasticus TaxID=574655 RepID=A0AAN7VSK1_9PEZI|nr:Protein phosphatase 2C 7 [Elasticomyces elasticus]